MDLVEAAGRVGLVDVTVRDGLQNERAVLGADERAGLVGRLVDAGARRLEVVSFVDPRRVPQMADAEEVVRRLPARPDASYIALCLNERGVDRALSVTAAAERGLDEIGCVLVASDALGLRNQGQDVATGLAANRRMLAAATQAGLVPQATIAAAFGCPFEGAVPPARVVELAVALVEAGAVEVALADTIGVATPFEVASLFGRVRAALPDGVRLRAHLHDTRGMATANALAAIGAGVTALDGSVGGTGGCPFAPNASGNVALEDLVYMLKDLGSGGMSLEVLISINEWLAERLGRPLPSLAARAGGVLRPAIAG